MDIQPLAQALNDLGVAEFDQSIYFTVFNHGSLSVSQLARSLHVQRPTIYAAIDRLRKHGLISSSTNSLRRNVTVEPPAHVLDLLEERRISLRQHSENLEEAIPALTATFSQASLHSTLRLFEGKKQYLAVFEEALREADKEILYYGNAQFFIDYIGLEYEKSWIKRRVRKGIGIRILVFRTELTERLDRDDPKELRETRFLEPNKQFKSSFMTYGTKVFIWNPTKEQSIVIDDVSISEMFIHVFETSWKSITPKNPAP